MTVKHVKKENHMFEYFQIIIYNKSQTFLEFNYIKSGDRRCQRKNLNLIFPAKLR